MAFRTPEALAGKRPKPKPSPSPSPSPTASVTPSPSPTPEPSPSPTTDPRLAWLAVRGTVLGFAVGGRDYTTELDKIRSSAPNYTPVVSRDFFNWGHDPQRILSLAGQRAALGIPRIVLTLSSKRSDGTKVMFADIINGVHDAYLLQLASLLSLNNQPVALLYLHEPHAHVTTYAPAGTTYEDACALYVQATRHIIDVWRSVNTISTFCYQSTEYRLNLGHGPYCYAGDGYIDLVGYTGANGYTTQNSWSTPLQRLDKARSFLRATGKPAAVFAGGSAEDPNDSPARKVAFYDSVTSAMQTEPLMKLYIMVSTYYYNTKSVQWIDTTPEALQMWSGVVQRPYHQP